MFVTGALPKSVNRRCSTATAPATTSVIHIDNAVRTTRPPRNAMCAPTFPARCFKCTGRLRRRRRAGGAGHHGEQRIAFDAGDLVMHLSTSVHRVEPSRVARLACFWIAIDGAARRPAQTAPHETDMAITALRQQDLIMLTRAAKKCRPPALKATRWCG
jgi:predicted 2-oxoglutarate/Fe(II)-dependent dioxygenase YbiX